MSSFVGTLIHEEARRDALLGALARLDAFHSRLWNVGYISLIVAFILAFAVEFNSVDTSSFRLPASEPDIGVFVSKIRPLE